VRFLPAVRTFPVFASGFPALSALTFKADGVLLGTGVADLAGSFDNLAAPFVAPEPLPRHNLRTVQLTAADVGGTVAGPVPVRITRIRVTMPAQARLTKRVRYRVYGFANDRKVYLHVRRGGRELGRFPLGRTHGPCGRLTKRLRFMPLRHFGAGTYEYWFSHDRHFSRATAVYRIGVSVFRSATPAGAAQATAAGSST
jgi:hypothetical protein